MDLARTFAEIGLQDRPTVGGKGANLGELARAGIPVPPGFVVTAGCFTEFVDSLDPDGSLRHALETQDANDVCAIADAGADMRRRIEGTTLPSDIAAALADAHRALCASPDLPVAVRSSATAEDAEDASFAGLQDTYLWLCGTDTVIHHVRACWASLYSTESLSYRRRLGMKEDGIAMAVVVQRMVDSRCSGVMFTRSPLTGDRSVIVIEGSYGLGSCIVSGEVTPDKFVISKVTNEISEHTVSHKTMQHTPDRDAGGVREEAVPDTLKDAACVSDPELRALADIARKIERHYGRPQDIEWAISRDGELLLLQSRPETVWSRKDAAPVTAPKSSALDHVFATFGTRR